MSTTQAIWILTIACYEPEGREFESLRAHHFPLFTLNLWKEPRLSASDRWGTLKTRYGNCILILCVYNRIAMMRKAVPAILLDASRKSGRSATLRPEPEI